MQESRYNGSEVLIERATPDQIHRALRNPENQSVLVGAPGAVITSVTGARYEVQKDGSFKRLDKKRKRVR